MLHHGATTSAEQTVCPTQSTTTFFTSLANTSCDVILVTGGGFALSQTEAALVLADSLENRVAISRNVTIRGETNTTILDLSYLKRRIFLDDSPNADGSPRPLIVLTMESLVLAHPRQPSDTSSGGFDIISATENTLLYVQDSVIVYGMCVPLSIAAKYSGNVPRPATIPGKNQTYALRNYTLCLPGLRDVTATALPPPAPGQAPPLQVASDCFSAAINMIDYALPNTRLDPQGLRIQFGAVWYIQTQFVCENAAKSSCFTTSCIQAAIDDLGLRRWDTWDLATPQEAGGGGGGGGTNVLPIVLPCVLGGLALVAVVVGVAFWRRQRRWATQGSGGGGGKDALESGSLYHDGQQPAAVAGVGRNGCRGAGHAVDGGGGGGGCVAGLEGLVSPLEGIRVASAGAGRLGDLSGAGRAGSGVWPDPSGMPPKYTAADGATQQHATANGDNGYGGAGLPHAYRSGTTSYLQSTCATGTGNDGGGLRGGGGSGLPGSSMALTVGLVSEGNLLGNPLVVRGSGQGGRDGSSQGHSQGGVALNLVLDQDVFVSREAVVGRGSFATVLEGSLAGRRVAVKMFHRDALGGTADDVKSLKQEIAILARCQHPNVVELLGAGSTACGDEVFLVEELMVSNLVRVIHEGEGMSLHQVLCVARDIATGLAYLHPTVIHRDLKPANVLLDPLGAAKLTDFGLSRLWASTVHTANPEAGTVQYMAPECFSGSLTDRAPATIAISHLSDIYSFGVMLWEMLAKERPWRGMTSIQVALAVGYEQQRLRIPEDDKERFHPKLRKLITQCWDADPRKRPGAAEIAKRLTLLIQRIEAQGSLTAGDGPACAPAGSGPGSFSSAAMPPSSGSLDPGSGSGRRPAGGVALAAAAAPTAPTAAAAPGQARAARP